jgi:hypothetical protein
MHFSTKSNILKNSLRPEEAARTLSSFKFVCFFTILLLPYTQHTELRFQFKKYLLEQKNIELILVSYSDFCPLDQQICPLLPLQKF